MHSKNKSKYEIQRKTFAMLWLLCLVLVILSAFIIIENQSLKSQLGNQTTMQVKTVPSPTPKH